MATSRPFAYNPSLLTLSGTINVGSICVGVDPLNVYKANYGGLTWWNGPDEELGYVIAVPVPSNTQPTPYPGVFASVGFWGTAIFSSPFSDTTFINLVNQVFSQSLTSGIDAAIWLFNNGYWTNYPLTSNTDASDYILQFVSAGGTIDSTITSALDVLFNDLQNNLMNGGTGPSFYSVLEGFYPMLGLTSATQGINANGNASYNLQFGGGWTFGSLGMQGNGINTYAYTGKDYIAYIGNELENTHFSIYGTVIGNPPSNGDLAVNGSYGRWVSIILNRIGDSGRYEYDCGNGTDSVPALGSGDFVTISAQFGSTYGYRNGSSESVGPISTFIGSAALYLGKNNFYGGCPVYNGVSVNTFGWSSFGTFMSTTDMGTYQTIVNTFMTSIGRNTYV
jgi:hypothetical protein